MTSPIRMVDGNVPFPKAERAIKDPNGLLAVGGDLSIKRLVSAYSQGIFPWYSNGDPILWWSPDPRAVFEVQNWKPSKTLRKIARDSIETVTLNQSFSDVIKHCSASVRAGQDGTWITEEMIKAYTQLHQAGRAFSVEVWQNAELVGGLYGVHLGRMVFGESMFSLVTNGSKLAFMAFMKHLKLHQFTLMDAQVGNAHTDMLGSQKMPRASFLHAVNSLHQHEVPQQVWAPQSLAF